MSTVIDARRRHFGVTAKQAKDERLGTALGRLAFRDMISETQYQAGVAFAQLYRDHHATVFDQLNLVNQNPTTVEIAQRALSAICHATGKLQVADSADLHLIPITSQVTVKPPKNGYGERNAIRYLVPAPGMRLSWPA